MNVDVIADDEVIGKTIKGYSVLDNTALLEFTDGTFALISSDVDADCANLYWHDGEHKLSDGEQFDLGLIDWNEFEKRNAASSEAELAAEVAEVEQLANLLGYTLTKK